MGEGDLRVIGSDAPTVADATQPTLSWAKSGTRLTSAPTAIGPANVPLTLELTVSDHLPDSVAFEKVRDGQPLVAVEGPGTNRRTIVPGGYLPLLLRGPTLPGSGHGGLAHCGLTGGTPTPPRSVRRVCKRGDGRRHTWPRHLSSFIADPYGALHFPTPAPGPGRPSACAPGSNPGVPRARSAP